MTLENIKLLMEIFAGGGTTIFMLVGAYLAIRGYNSWRREHFDKMKYKFAEEAMAIVPMHTSKMLQLSTESILYFMAVDKEDIDIGFEVIELNQKFVATSAIIISRSKMLLEENLDTDFSEYMESCFKLGNIINTGFQILQDKHTPDLNDVISKLSPNSEVSKKIIEAGGELELYSLCMQRKPEALKNKFPTLPMTSTPICARILPI